MNQFDILDWDVYPNFTAKEFNCSYTGENKMQPAFMQTLQRIRDLYARPMIISSGYRSLEHPLEKTKLNAGEHTLGLAADVLVGGSDALDLLTILIQEGVRRIGLNQKGPFENRFVHIGIGDRFGLYPEAIWSY